jgi:hypothetical protein
MTTQVIYALGSSGDISIPANSKIAIACVGGALATLSTSVASANYPATFAPVANISGSTEYLSSAFSVATTARVENSGPGAVYINVGAAPVLTVPLPGVPSVQQAAPTAKTVSSTMSAADLLALIITLNQAAGAATAQQLPLASAMDTALPEFVAGDAFDFSVINTSVVDAEDGSITTNTGWTLVGNMDVHAYSAAGSLNSSGRFRARKTGTAAWTLYRIS